jgi:protease inhibitor Inh
MHDTRPAFRASTLILVLLALTGCSGIEWPGSNSAPTASAAQAGSPPVSLAGRWQLSSPSRGQCNMTFGASSPAAPDGTIAPEGGCPGKFYMSRKWTYDQTGLTLRDHNGQPLAQLAGEGGGFQGKATSGEPVALMR